MTHDELKELRKAIKSVSKPEHSLHIEGDSFMCEFKNGEFVWTAPSGEKYILNIQSVLRYINHGEHVKYYSYDYVC